MACWRRTDEVETLTSPAQTSKIARPILIRARLRFRGFRRSHLALLELLLACQSMRDREASASTKPISELQKSILVHLDIGAYMYEDRGLAD